MSQQKVDQKKLDKKNRRSTLRKKKIEEVELQTTKNFLIQELSEIKRNKDPLDEVTKKRFFEEYDAYIARKQNSYIKHEVEECQKKGLL